MTETEQQSLPDSFTWTRAHKIGLFALCLAGLVDAIDVTVVNVALPTVQRELDFSAADLPWVVNAYLVLFSGFLLVGGRAGDLFGHRRIFLGGVVLFTAASFGSAVAQNAFTLVVTRGVQGLTAAFIIPMTLALIAIMFPEGKPRLLAMAVWSGAAGISTSLGLILGGVLVDGPGWRWIFWINLPIGLVLVVTALMFLPSGTSENKRHKFDLVGAVSGTAALCLIAYGMAQTDTHGWTSGRTIALLGGGVALLVYFLVHERYLAGEPIMPLSIFRIRAVSGANAVSALCGSAMFGTFFCATLYQQEVLHYSPLKTGLSFLPLTAMLLVVAALGPLLVKAMGLRYTMVLGSVVSAVSLAWFTQISADGELLTDVILPSTALGLGLGIVFFPIMTAGLMGVSAEDKGLASALLNVTRYVGGALGLAIMSSFVTSRTEDQAKSGHAPELALNSGLHVGFAIGAGLMAASAIAGFILLHGVNHEDDPVEGASAPAVAA
ncbi:putative MFS-type transporter EfpA [Actinomadura rubteroloni]|uniref:Putative MFS-type transporter EfpA n=1 Tax=Actinomadura rubteroloni TaxID=1926885 RepID=A0A2P4UBX8_9ACTN|nr:MFS transporter [Actinomadura rubteroloni]POM22538.1 putative MFS-type transporter EfpA [Actinomadura rubteroloni]